MNKTISFDRTCFELWEASNEPEEVLYNSRIGGFDFAGKDVGGNKQHKTYFAIAVVIFPFLRNWSMPRELSSLLLALFFCHCQLYLVKGWIQRTTVLHSTRPSSYQKQSDFSLQQSTEELLLL